MRKVIGKVMFVCVLVVVVSMLTGCTNWKKKYQGLHVEKQNLEGLYENCVSSLDLSISEKGELGQQLVTSQQTIEELQAKIAGRNIPVDEATGFSGMDVRYDNNAGTITVTLPNTILFSSGKATLKKSTNTELNHILTVLNNRYGGNRIEVVGHTDTDPIKKSKWKDNWELSAQRALSVLRYLAGRGIASERIVAVAAGSSKPIASNANASGKARNRRVEVVVNLR